MPQHDTTTEHAATGALADDAFSTPHGLTPDQTDDLARTSGAVAASISTPSSPGPVIDAGFLLDSIEAPGAGYGLRLDYSGTGPNGEVVTYVELQLDRFPFGNNLFVDFGEGTRGFRVANFERLEATGSGGNDFLIGGAGNDILRGGPGDDVLSGQGGNDILIGGAGNDTLDGGEGQNIMEGGEGDDTFYARAGDQVDGGPGNDIIERLDLSGYTGGSITLRPGSGQNLSLSDGTTIANVERYGSVILGDTDDTFDAGFFLGNAEGGVGEDLLRVDYSGVGPNGEVVTYVELQLDRFPFGNNLFVDFGEGTRGFRVANFERLEATGSGGNDFLIGGAGNDILRGGPGDDVLSGQGGYDTYVFAPGWGNDTIGDPDPSGRLLFLDIQPNQLTFDNVNGDLIVTRGADRITFGGYYTNGYAYDIDYGQSPPPPTDLPTLSVADPAPVAEGDGQVVFTVTLSAPSTLPVTVTYSTLFGTANAGGAQTDYVGVVDQTLTFAPGETEKQIAITLIDDDIPEADETFQLLLENPTNATLANDRATATIVDDDGEVPPDRSFDFASLPPISQNILLEAANLAVAAYQGTTDRAAQSNWTPLPRNLLASEITGFDRDGIHSVQVTGLPQFNTTLHAYLGNVDSVPTLALAFRGSDENGRLGTFIEILSQSGRWPAYYASHKPFLDQAVAWANEQGVQILVTGHSLGGILAEYAAADPDLFGAQSTAYFVTFGSPGAPVEASATRILNFAHANDPVPSGKFDPFTSSREGKDILLLTGGGDGGHASSNYIKSLRFISQKFQSELGSKFEPLDFALGTTFDSTQVIGEGLLDYTEAVAYQLGLLPSSLLIDLGSGIGKNLLTIGSISGDNLVPLAAELTESGFSILGNIATKTVENALEIADDVREIGVRLLDLLPLAADNSAVWIGGAYAVNGRISPGSAVIELDETGDGRIDTIIRFVGDYDLDLFNFRITDIGLEITYGEGPPPDFGEIRGTTNNETLQGTPLDDIIRGVAGNNVIRGLDGDDVLFAGIGDDTLEGGSGNDQLFAYAGSNIPCLSG